MVLLGGSSAYLMHRCSSAGLSRASAVLKLNSMASEGSQLISDSLQPGMSAIQGMAGELTPS